MSSNVPDYKILDKSMASPTPPGTAKGIPVGYPAPGHPNVPVNWSSGLCDCFSDWKLCCLTCWCPCITFGRIAEIVDKGSSSCALSGGVYTLMALLLGCPYFYSCFYRTKMRQQYSLAGGACGDDSCGDCLVHCCCEECALCQEYRELQNRGYDMSIGWHANLEKRNREVGMTGMGAPGVQEGMRR